MRMPGEARRLLHADAVRELTARGEAGDDDLLLVDPEALRDVVDRGEDLVVVGAHAPAVAVAWPPIEMPMCCCVARVVVRVHAPRREVHRVVAAAVEADDEAHRLRRVVARRDVRDVRALRRRARRRSPAPSFVTRARARSGFGPAPAFGSHGGVAAAAARVVLRPARAVAQRRCRAGARRAVAAMSSARRAPSVVLVRSRRATGVARDGRRGRVRARRRCRERARSRRVERLVGAAPEN